MKCKNCSKELVQVQGKVSKVFCSDRCQKAYSRKLLKSQLPTPTSDKSTTDNLRQATSDTDDFIKKFGQFCKENGDRIIGKCRWCGKVIRPEIYGNCWDLVECCYDCVAKKHDVDRNLYPKE
jgi:endogenous inhibitor of DNA gyrase (YacG/DUF329 family)